MKGQHEKAQVFLGSLATKAPELPFEPTLMPRLFASTAHNSMATLEQISALVERSQGLAARILRVANSAYYGMHTAVSSLAIAIRLLGLNELRSIIMQIGILSTVRTLKLPAGFDFQKLWEHQLVTAVIARALAQAMPASVSSATLAEEVYAAGLLHDLGKTLIAASCPEELAAINTLAAEQNLPFHRAEDAYWGIDHSVVGSRLLTFWGLPAQLTEPVSWHHAPDLAPPKHAVAVGILAAANELSRIDRTLLTQEGFPGTIETLLPKGITREGLEQAVAACADPAKIRDLSTMAAL